MHVRNSRQQSKCEGGKKSKSLLHALHSGQLWIVHIRELGVVNAVCGGVRGIGQSVTDDVLAGRQSGAELFEQILAGADGGIRGI